MSPELLELRPYQLQIVRAIYLSVMERRGLTFSVMVARQGGKNEISAQVELLLLQSFQREEGTIVKTAPTRDPQLEVSWTRLLQRLREAGVSARRLGDRIEVGAASITFLSAQPHANVVGHTASLLLEVDEAQDVDSEKFERDFRPMILATGATVVFYGTTWAPDSLVEKVKAHHLKLESEDGIQRHYQYDWQAIARDFPEYEGRAEEQLRYLGPGSPIWQSQFCLVTQEAAGRLFSREQIDGVRGEHSEQPGGGMAPRGVAERALYVAGLDIGGQSESARRDPTVLTIARVLTNEHGLWPGEFPQVEIVKHVSWQTNWDAIFADVVEWHRHYNLRHLCVDATGLGHHVSGALERALGSSRVERLSFTAQSKSDLLYLLLDSVDAGRVKMYSGGDKHSRQFWQQLEKARVVRRARGLSGFEVPDNLGHDDYLVSLALCLRAAESARPRLAFSRSRN